MEPEVVHKYLSQFHTCPGCGEVFPANGMDYIMVEMKAPCCGAKGPRGMWPDSAVVFYIETALRQKPGDEATPRIQVLMLAAAAELMLERVVWTALENRISNGAVALALMDRCEGTYKLKEVFKELVGESVDAVLRREKFEPWAQIWVAVSTARNSVAHGQWDHKAVDDAKLASFAKSLIPASAALWNAAVRSAKPSSPSP